MPETISSSGPDLPILLLVDDEQNILAALERALHGVNATIVSFSSANEALLFCRHNCPEVIISDQRMSEMQGCDFLAKVRELWPESQRIILSAHQDFQQISAAFKSGIAERFIGKPWDNKELKDIVTQALVQRLIERSLVNPPPTLPLDQEVNFHGMVSADEAMKELFDSIRLAAATKVPIFIAGETGTGKELVARACYQEGFEDGQPFMAINCANFTEHLMESQLFGHVKGAFTGALSFQQGVLAAAKTGTLFLDEITTLSEPLQAKLLRVVQEREFHPVGSNRVVKFLAQLISAASNSIWQAVLNGHFREDLYYRLNVITFVLPPLRERGNDVVLIARHFLRKYAKTEHKHFTGFSRASLQIICQYYWPGNVRQLENVIHGIIILNTGPEITSKMVIKALSNTALEFSGDRRINHHDTSESRGLEQNKQPASADEILPLWQVEKRAIEAAISHCNGNVPQAASLLELSPSTIYRKKQGWANNPKT